jgi:hypothetical protein
MHTKYPLEPIKIFATKDEVECYQHRSEAMDITTIGESQAMMEMIKHIYNLFNNFHEISTGIERMHMELGALVWEQDHGKGIFARRKLTLDAIRSTHAEFYDLPDDNRLDTSPNPSNQTITALEKVAVDAFVP